MSSHFKPNIVRGRNHSRTLARSSIADLEYCAFQDFEGIAENSEFKAKIRVFSTAQESRFSTMKTVNINLGEFNKKHLKILLEKDS